MAKRTFDTAITADIRSVAGDCFKDSIRMLEIGKLRASEENFYSMSELELLAEDIERQGLKHNLVVCEDPDAPDTYFIISGHRRFAAISLLVGQGRYTSKYVPCFVSGAKTKAETMLDLIMLNATARKMTDAEYLQQYEFLEQTLKEMDTAGTPIGGRLRERIAEALHISPSQVSKIENILHNGIEEVQQAVQDGDMSISTAAALSSLPEEVQIQMVEETPVSEIRNKDVQERKAALQQESSSEEDVPHMAQSDEDDEVESVAMFEDDEIPEEPMEFQEALNIALSITATLKGRLHSMFNSAQLYDLLDDVTQEFEKLKGAIENG